ncbi:hypothetical protein Tco_0901453 [Tanacetum coccineum]
MGWFLPGGFLNTISIKFLRLRETFMWTLPLFATIYVEVIKRIYEIKGRKLTIPLAICVGPVSDIGRFVVTDHLPFRLL